MVQTDSMREAYGRALVELGKRDSNIVVLDADLSKSTMTRYFAEKFPERFFDCGLGEQNMVGIAAGLAASGKIPFASTFAVFVPGRTFDQLRMSVAQPGLNVKIVCTHGGISVGEDGASHHSIEDLGLACSLPGFRVVVPADAAETTQAVMAAASTPGPFYVRLCRPASDVVHSAECRFQLGVAEVLREGYDVAVIATGLLVTAALEAAAALAGEGVSCRVLNMSTLKPLDHEAVTRAATETGAIVTAEEHLLHGGLGSLVAQTVAETHPVPMAMVGVKDTYAKSASAGELFQHYGLTAADIAQGVRSVLQRKASGAR